jgi:hypothetical protein
VLKTKVNCGTCMFYETGNCKLWQGGVAETDCCMAHDSPAYK